MKEHQAVQDLLIPAASGDLSPEAWDRVQAHLNRCAVCREELDAWRQLAGALRALPTPEAPAGLLERTRRRLAIHAAAAKPSDGPLLPGLLIAFSWCALFLNYRFMRLIDMPLAQWLEISSTAVRIAYIGLSWLVAALAAALLVRHSRQEKRIP